MDPPQQREEWAVRLLAALFARFDLDANGDTLEAEQVEDLVRALPQLLEQMAVTAAEAETPLHERIEQALDQLLEAQLFGASPPVPAVSPPELRLPIHPDAARQILDAAMLVWVIEVRPQVHAGACTGQPVDSIAQCVLLARLQFGVEQTGGQYRIAGDIEDWFVDQSERPYLLHGRLVQELGGNRL